MLQEVAQPHAATAAPPGIWSSTHRSLTIGLILTVSGAAFEALAVATTLPATIKDLGGLALYGWAFSAFMLANLIGITVAGAEADRQGPARPFIAGIATFVLGLLVVGLAPSMLVFILGRAVQGFGAGVISSVAYIGIGRGYPEAAKPRMLAVLSSAWVVPGLIGPALAGLISDFAGWRWVFLGLVPFLVDRGHADSAIAAAAIRRPRCPARLERIHRRAAPFGGRWAGAGRARPVGAADHRAGADRRPARRWGCRRCCACCRRERCAPRRGCPPRSPRMACSTWRFLAWTRSCRWR